MTHKERLSGPVQRIRGQCMKPTEEEGTGSGKDGKKDLAELGDKELQAMYDALDGRKEMRSPSCDAAYKQAKKAMEDAQKKC